MFSRQRRHEQAASPLGKQPARVEADAGRCDVRRPEVDGLLHPRLRGLVAVDRLAVVVVSVPDYREAVIPASRDRVDLVAAPRAVFACPQLAGMRMKRHTLIVSNTQRKDFRPYVGSPNERIVGGNGSVRLDSKILAHQAVQLLWLWPVFRVDADAGGDRRRDEEGAVGRLNEAPSDSLGIQKHLHLFEPRAIRRELGPRDHQMTGEPWRRCSVSGWSSRVGEENLSSHCERVIGNRLEQSLWSHGPDRREAINRIRKSPVCVDGSQPARALREQNALVRQKVKPEATCDACRHGFDVVRNRDRRPRRARLAGPLWDRRITVGRNRSHWWDSGGWRRLDGWPRDRTNSLRAAEAMRLKHHHHGEKPTHWNTSFHAATSFPRS